MSVGERLNCKRCGHEWYARAAGRPVQCPRCKSPAWDRPPQVSEVKAGYKAGSPRSARDKGPIGRAGGQDIDWTKHPSFGIWADRTETDEELLERLGGGWGHIENDEVVSD